ncbi:hypothetical protein [Bradyrhizobium arachidis]|uniref:hypothetical protein n=1 Tax=Bradyrhizobium arachidis TaxID=858423 RepID=UPI0008DFE9BD|nr:hypothetical protein [Bradyrhizobium arachidis]SFV00706.1 hypothetical protein SAMN05192541_109249 [Bradyrhizobium arachidis]
MRKVVVVAFLALGLTPALAQDAAKAPDDKKLDPKTDNCFYTVGTQAIQVPIGASVCRRQPAPYNDKYSLLRCTPPLDELASDVKRGDARCDRYDERE